MMIKKYRIIFDTIMILLGGAVLIDSDAYYVPYLFIMILAIICAYTNDMDNYAGGYKNPLINFSAVVFSVIIIVANYPIWMTRDLSGISFEVCYKIVLCVIIGLSGYCAAHNILYCSVCKLERFSWKKKTYNISPLVFFVVPFILISALNIMLLFSCRYPGVLTADSIDQVTQLMTGVYSNHHPVYHTMTIRLFVTIGLKLFNDMNKAAAFYCVFQILFMAMCFSIVIYTLFQMNISLRIIIVTAIWYILMPFHIVYSFTMWKDVCFGGLLTLFTVYLFRILKSVGNKICNYTALFITGVGVCLFRSNGFFAFTIAVAVFLLLFRKEQKKLLMLLLGIALLSFSMKHIVLSVMDIKQSDMIEALSVPAQQIARVAVEHNDFTDNQRALLGQVVNVDELSAVYTSWISNPVKNLVRDNGNQQYIAENKAAFASLYFQVGLKHPITYIKAWVDETKGFWNAGYSYWIWADEVYENTYGLQRVVHSEQINNFLNAYLWYFSNNRILQLFLSIGFYVWIVAYLFFMSIIRKDKTSILIIMPTLAVILSLWISTPVYSEFRYAYGMFCSIPFMILATFHKN